MTTGRQKCLFGFTYQVLEVFGYRHTATITLTCPYIIAQITLFCNSKTVDKCGVVQVFCTRVVNLWHYVIISTQLNK